MILSNDRIKDYTSFAAKVGTSGFRGNTTVFRILHSCQVSLACLADCILSHAVADKTSVLLRKIALSV